MYDEVFTADQFARLIQMVRQTEDPTPEDEEILRKLTALLERHPTGPVQITAFR